jgi:hypothetical protein
MTMLTMPFALGESPLHGTSGETVNMSHLLGTRYVSGSGKVYMLVKLAEDDIDVQKRVFIWSDRANYTVTRSVTTAADVAGVGYSTMIDQSPATGSYLLLQIRGRATVRHGSEGSNTLDATRMYAVQDVSDAGEVEGTATAPSAATNSRVYVGRYISGTAADNADIVVELHHEIGN